MKNHEIKFRNLNNQYSIIIGKNILTLLPKKIKILCPRAKKIALIVDKNVPDKFKKGLKKILKSYDLNIFLVSANEKFKSMKIANFYLNKLLYLNFNRSDLVISVGGGIIGDLVGFVASIYKRGLNFINIPTTLLAQADASIGGKTGLNSIYGKNLIGSFYQPKLVLSDANFLKSLSKRERVCGYAEILKHAIIKDVKLFKWLENNTKNLLLKNPNQLLYAIKRSCQIKISFVGKDVNEKGLRMILNFGHTFAHALEVKNNYSKKISHGEAVLSGMMIALRISHIKKICKINTLKKIINIYESNNLDYTYEKFSNYLFVNKLIPYLLQDKKNNDEKVNFILLKKIGKTTEPNKFKISADQLRKLSKVISQY